MANAAEALDLVPEVSPEGIEAAAEAARALAKYSSAPRVRLAVEADPSGSPIVLPADIFGQVIELLTKIANGNAVSIVPVDAELTTQQAAHLLNVSRPHVIKLIERGELGHRMVGTHRKVPAKDVLCHRQKIQARQSDALRRMVELDERIGDD